MVWNRETRAVDIQVTRLAIAGKIAPTEKVPSDPAAVIPNGKKTKSGIKMSDIVARAAKTGVVINPVGNTTPRAMVQAIRKVLPSFLTGVSNTTFPVHIEKIREQFDEAFPA